MTALADSVHWAPGASDGIVSHHLSPREQEEQVDFVVTALHVAAANPTPENLRALLVAISSESAISYLDEVMRQLSNLPIDQRNIHEIARWLAVTGIGRDAVKCGMALLCLSGLHDDDYQILQTLARHDEFTLYAVIGILNTFEPSEAEKAIFEIT